LPRLTVRGVPPYIQGVFVVMPPGLNLPVNFGSRAKAIAFESLMLRLTINTQSPYALALLAIGARSFIQYSLSLCALRLHMSKISLISETVIFLDIADSYYVTQAFGLRGSTLGSLGQFAT